MRRVLSGIQSPRTLEFVFRMLSLPLLRGVAERVFFGEGSFPDVDANHIPSVHRGVEVAK